MTSNDPDQIRREIEQTRRQLSADVNELGETVSPANVAQRQKDKVTGKVNEIKDRVMGSGGSDPTSGPSATEQASQRVRGLQGKAKAQTQGNPLAVGLIALGAGWLVGSMLPASEKERQTTQQLKEQAQPLIQRGTDEAKAVGKEMQQNLKGPAQEAAQDIKDQAQQSGERLKSEGESTAQDVKASGQQAKDNVQESRESGS